MHNVKTTCVLVANVQRMGALPFERYGVMYAQGFGFFVESRCLRHLMSAEEICSYETDLKQEAYMEKVFGQDQCHVPCFASIEHALEYVDAQDAMSSLWEDLRAFGAPSECADLPSRRIEFRIEKAEENIVCFINPPVEESSI